MAETAPQIRRRLLVIDDNRELSALIVRFLGRWQVVVCASGREARARLDAGGRFDALVCDLDLPDTSGADLFTALIAHQPGLRTRTVFISGGSLDEDLDDFLARAGQPVLRKPFLLPDLERLIDDLAEE